jgi:hypothetical protein
VKVSDFKKNISYNYLYLNLLILKQGEKMTKAEFLKEPVFERIIVKSNIIKGLYVDLNWDCGEGSEGDFDDSDPNDEPYLRFDVMMEDETEINDASYCTLLKAYDDRNLLIRGVEAILKEAEESWQESTQEFRFKKRGEFMSWIQINNDGILV